MSKFSWFMTAAHGVIVVLLVSWLGLAFGTGSESGAKAPDPLNQLPERVDRLEDRLDTIEDRLAELLARRP